MDDSLESRLKATLNVIPAFTWYAMPNGGLTFMNNRSADYAGLPADHPLRLGIDTGAAWDSHLAMLHPDDHEETRRVWAQCLKTGTAGEVTFRVRDAQGVYRWRISRAEPLRADDGTLLYWIGINFEIEELKRAEQALRDIVESIPGMVWVAQADGANVYVNSRYAEYSGLSSQHTAGSGWRVAVHPDDLERHAAKWRAAVASGAPHESEVRFRRADGQYRWHLDRGLPMRDPNGNIIKWYGAVTDIEDRKRAEEALRRNQDFLVQAQKLSHTGSFGWNMSTDEHFWSDETFRIFEFDHSVPVSLQRILACIHPRDLPSVEAAIARAAGAEGIDLEIRLRMPDGRTKYLHVVGKSEKNAVGSVEVIGAVMDVTARKLTEIELRRSKGYLLDAQVLSHVGSVGMDVGTQRIFWSDESARIYGYAAGTEPTADLILQRVHPEDRHLVSGALERAARGEHDFDYENRLVMPDGSIKHIYNLCHKQDDEAGQTEIVGAIMDITERREQESELRQALDLAPQLVAVFGPNRERIYANRVALAYLGMTLEHWQQQEAGSEMHPDDAQRVRDAAARGMKSHLPYELEVRIRKSDGTYRWFLARYNPMHADRGHPTRWYVACTDIEDRKVAEERLQQENVALREEIDKTSMFEEIVGASPSLTAMLSQLAKVARSDSTVLISGETGTGKELAARAIHRRSKRASKPFVAVNCAGIPHDLMASELFGHEKGAFTGAVQRRLGRFELANGGTLFLDEVAELPPDTQAALLRVLQERELERVGGTETIRVDVRVIAATNRDLAEAVANGTFRQDLFYRLNVFPLEMPSLRERKPDIPVLVEYFIHRFGRKAGKTFRRIDRRTLDRLQSYPWPGNVRELQNVIERSVVVGDNEDFVVDGSWLSTPAPKKSIRALPGKLASHEKTLIEEALRATGGRVFGPEGAAARLGIPRSTLESRIRSLKINKARFRPVSSRR